MESKFLHSWTETLYQYITRKLIDFITFVIDYKVTYFINIYKDLRLNNHKILIKLKYGSLILIIKKKIGIIW